MCTVPFVFFFLWCCACQVDALHRSTSGTLGCPSFQSIQREMKDSTGLAHLELPSWDSLLHGARSTPRLRFFLSRAVGCSTRSCFSSTGAPRPHPVFGIGKTREGICAGAEWMWLSAELFWQCQPDVRHGCFAQFSNVDRSFLDLRLLAIADVPSILISWPQSCSLHFGGNVVMQWCSRTHLQKVGGGMNTNVFLRNLNWSLNSSVRATVQIGGICKRSCRPLVGLSKLGICDRNILVGRSS